MSVLGTPVRIGVLAIRRMVTVVFGLCSATSAMFLFGKNYLHLDPPKLGVPKKGKSVLVWGGSSAVGSNAIQLVTGAGYDVIATCSKKNFDYVKNLGAVKIFDYKDTDVIEKLAKELDKGECAGIFMAAGLKDGNAAACKVAAASKQSVPRHLPPTPIQETDTLLPAQSCIVRFHRQLG